MEIRKARPGDIPGLSRLWLEVMEYHRRLDTDYELSEGALDRWVDYITSKFDDETAQLFVADKGGELVAYTGAVIRDYPPVFTIERYGFIEEIAVTEKYRRQGIACRLFETAEKWLLSHELDRIEVRIDCANPASQGFFRNQGFQDHVVALMRKY